MMRFGSRLVLIGLLGVLGVASLGEPVVGAGEDVRALPRFASLRADEVNLRTGPGRRYPVEWKLVREGMPVEILLEYNTWRKIRDQEGTVGWVHQSMLSGRRTIVVTGSPRTLRRQPADDAPPRAVLEPGVIADLYDCATDGAWCRIGVRTLKGWLKRDEFWGVYAGETVN